MTTSGTSRVRRADRLRRMAQADEGGATPGVRRVGIYSRISQDRDEKALGVERQEDACKAEALRRGWQVVGLPYRDNNISGSKRLQREHYQRLLGDLDSGRIDAVLAYDNARLTRNLGEWAEFLEFVARHDVVVGFVVGDADITTADGRMTAGIMGVVAHREAEKIGERVRAAFVQKRSDGEWLGGTRPFGWDVKRDVVKVDKDGIQQVGPGYLVVNVEEKRAVAQACRRIIKGESLGAIAAEWNSANLRPTGKAKEWSRTTVRQVLLRPRNAGWIEYQGELVAPGKWKPLVSLDIWRQVERKLVPLDGEQRVVNGRVVPPIRTTTARVHLLSGLATCGICGAPMKSAKATNRDKTTRTVYRCGATEVTTKEVKGKEVAVERPLKGHPNRNAEPIEEKVTEYVIARLLTTDSTALLYPADDDEQAALAEATVEVQARMDDLVEAYRSRGLTIDVFTSTMALLQQDLEAIERKRQPATNALVLEGLTDVASEEELRAVWEDLPLTRKRAVIGVLFTVKVGASGRAGTQFDGTSIVITPK